MSIKVLAQKDTPDNLIEIKTKGYDGAGSLCELFKSITKITFVAVDKDDWECSKAFYFNNSRIKAKFEEVGDTQLITLTAAGNILPIIEMVMHIGKIGGYGHSFEFETSHGFKGGWDGDGADRIVEVKLNGKIINNRLEGNKLRERIAELRERN